MHTINLQNPLTKAVRVGIKDKADDPPDENILDATIKELQGIAESANVGEVQHTIEIAEVKDYTKINSNDEETQQLIEPDNEDSQEMQDFK